ncbi:MAG: VCBS repeat-containing protein, partial [Candidatus Cloacimonetes bacterium]|nr:VCBS repeat-containing protein [Candidatus Cloacimonadota bacterium]
MKYPLVALILVISAFCFGLSNDEIRFLTDKEQFQLVLKHSESILSKAITGDEADLRCVLGFAQRSNQAGLAILCHKRLATEYGSLEDALHWLLLMQSSEVDSLEFIEEIDAVGSKFSNPVDIAIFSHYAYGAPEGNILEAIADTEQYNSVIEAMAKSSIDEISIQVNDSLAIDLINSFTDAFPHSKYAQIAYYYLLYNISNQKDWQALNTAITDYGYQSPMHAYIAALYLISPTYRKTADTNKTALSLASDLLKSSVSSQTQTLLYDIYTSQDWQNRIDLQKVKIAYYKLLESHNLWGDEPLAEIVTRLPKNEVKKLLAMLRKISFSNNDRGEISELHYWMGRVHLLNNPKSKKAAENFGKCLSWGSPRRKYDIEAWNAILAIHKSRKVKETPQAWMRRLLKYNGIVFEDVSTISGLNEKGYSRVALGDFNADSNIDILFSGSHLYRNEGNMSFIDVSDSLNIRSNSSTGGLFADFNRDGLLDIVSLSNASEGRGELLLKNQNGTRFVNVNERAGDINDSYPSEAAAWIDLDGTGYPSLYVANYEKWQVRNGFPDFYWDNDKGYFSDKSEASGILFPEYTTNPGQAGRGVAPADFDNDGKQEILVTNYRLNRNFCWKQVDSLFVDMAALYGLTGSFKQGYYGHSIGADWGDYDNDGDLDLFVANLAHPRYIDISDKSMLLRNDGLAYRIVEQDTVYYWQFTDVTTQAGISYDELHADPLFIDADNDGFLDLFVTSVYENDRSYLYRNNGNGTFSDITWLAGARVYNGWGNASADLDRDGFPDIVVGSGNGVRILHNKT